MRVYVYRNLHKDCWSLLLKGILYSHRQRLTLTNVEFRVRPGGQARAVREGRKNVHAFAIGDLIDGLGGSLGGSVSVRYDLPSGTFIDNQGRKILSAGRVRLFPEGAVKAWDVVREI